MFKALQTAASLIKETEMAMGWAKRDMEMKRIVSDKDYDELETLRDKMNIVAKELDRLSIDTNFSSDAEALHDKLYDTIDKVDAFLETL